MKKMVMAMAVAIAAVTVNAAAVSWNLTNVMDTTDPTTKSSGYAVYVFATTDTTSTFNTTTVAAIVDSITDGTFDASKAMSSSTTTNGGAAQTGIGSFGAGDSIAGFAVIFDGNSYDAGNNYIVTGIKSQSFTSSIGSKALAFGSQAGATWTSYSVPEPTSGLLLLLGVAGLALKRKRA